MRKKIVLAALCAAMLCGAWAVHASTNRAPGLGMEQLQWRRSLAAVVGGYTDSVAIAFRLPVTTAFSDTTTPFNTARVMWGSPPATAIYGWGRCVFQTSTADADCDTFFVSIQVSADGNKWSTSTTNPIALGPQSDSSQLTFALSARPEIELNNSGSGALMPYMRFIVSGDNNVVAANVRVWVVYASKENN